MPWQGIGAFDATKLDAYESGDLNRLGRHDEALKVLDAALAGFGPTMRRHRCTALIDRAEVRLAVVPSGRSDQEHELGDRRRRWVNQVPPAGLILDFGGVLTSDFFEVLRGFCRREGLPEDALLRLISIDDGAKGVLVDLERGAIRQPEFEAQVAELLGVPRAGLLRRIMAGLQPNKPVLEACEHLRRQGVKVGVLSNSWGTEPFDPYEPWHLEKNFDSIVISHRVGLRKPDPRIFELAAQRLGLTPGECVYVDDIAVYLEPARKMGMRVVRHTDAAVTVRKLESIFAVSFPI